MIRKSILTALASILVAAAPAGASGVASEGGVLRFTAAAGEYNDALVMPGDDGGLLVADSGSALAEPGAGCGPADGFALCDDARAITLALGDEDDVASVDAALVVPATIDGGDGGDLLAAGGGPTLIRGAAGDDFINGGDGDDSVDAGSGADYVVAGGGDDRIAARDGEDDSISCGDGRDTVTADSGDTVDPDCERVSTTGGPPGLSDPAVGAGPGGTSSPGAAPGARRAERAGCAPRGRWISCAVRLSDPAATGRFNVTLKRGPVLIARGRGRVSAGAFRVRMRLRGRIPNGDYQLWATVQPDGGRPFRRMWYVGVLVIGR